MVTIMPRQDHGMMLGPMRGHMAPNSSPFKPTINKLSSQYLIQDHMSSHYMKLGTVKSAIDSKPPKSMTSSVKKRDQMRREAMAKQMKLFDFEKGMKHGGGASNRHSLDSGGYGSQRMLSATVSKNGLDEPRPQSVSSYRSDYTSRRPRPTSSQLKSPRDKTQARKPDVLTETYSGDYLDRHEDRFKNGDAPFTPRLKKREGKSYLSRSKHYAPPLVIGKETKRKVAVKNKFKGDTPTASPRSSVRKEEKAPKKKKYLEDLGKCDNLVSYSRKQLTAIISGLKGKGDKCAEREASEIVAKIAREAERELMQRFDKVSCDRGADEYGVRQPNVSARTASDSEMIEDQARSQRRSSLDSRKTYDNIYPGQNSYDAYGFRHGAEDTFFGTSSFSGQFSRNDAFSSHTKDRIEAEEEEMKYLEFINTVTNDILTRGVYSDRVLTQVMERHVIANRDRLEEGRMRLMLKKLLQDIGVSPGSTVEQFETSSEYSTKYNHVYSVPRRSSSRDQTTSRKSYKAAKESSVDLSDGDHFTPKPKKRGILKSSSGSDLDRRSALSSGDEKERESESRVENKTDVTENEMNMTELAEVLDSAETPPLSRKSVSIEEGLNEAGSIKSNSAHSLTTLRSNSKTSDQQRDSDDF